MIIISQRLLSEVLHYKISENTIILQQYIEEQSKAEEFRQAWEDFTFHRC